MKIVLFGRNGQVGRALSPVLAQLGQLVAFGRDEADLDLPASLPALIEREAPDIIVNAAAYTAVDAAEEDKARCWAVNAEAVEIIGKAANAIGARVVHFSTDCVFDGSADGFQREDQPTSPLSVYGASKLCGEVLLAATGASHLILRVSWIYANEGRNFPLSILRLARERETLDVVADEIGAPTSATLVAEMTARAIGEGSTGLYHLAAAGETSRHELARFVVAEALAAGARLKLMPDAIRPIAARDYPAKARRPLNSRLDTSRFRRTFGMQLPPWQDGVRQLIKTLAEEGRL